MRKTSNERIEEAFNFMKKAITGVYNTALLYPEGKETFINAVWRRANTDRGAVINWLNKNTEIHYETN
jgi:hypothetical protein